MALPAALLHSAATGQRHSSLPGATVLAAARLPGLLEERELRASTSRAWDKAFACAWLDGRHAAVGTKCNHLLLLDTVTGAATDVPLPRAPPRPPAPPAAGPWTSPPAPFGGPLGAGMHGLALSPDGALLATGGANVADCQVLRVDRAAGAGAPSLTPLQTLVGHHDWVFGLDWVTERHVVTGSRDRTVALWSVDPDAAAAAAAAADADDDGDAYPFRAPTPFSRAPLAVRADKRERVRDVRVARDAGRVTSLGTGGTLRLWDAQLTPLAEVGLTRTNECVCVAVGGHGGALAAVGSAGHVEVVDWRVARGGAAPAVDAPLSLLADSVDGHHGVRSIVMTDGGATLVVGTGTGRVGFFDVRGGGWRDLGPPPPSQAAALAAVHGPAGPPAPPPFLPYAPQASPQPPRPGLRVHAPLRAVAAPVAPALAPTPRGGVADALAPAPPPARTFLQSGPGWTCQDAVFHDHFAGRGALRHAVYAMAFAPGAGSLLAVGGPLASGLKGCYMAHWR